MYTSFQLLRKYIHYRLRSSNGRGHGVHSPFVFDFITNVLNGKSKHETFSAIEALRRRSIQDRSIIDVVDFGAGSKSDNHLKRPVSQIAKNALKPKKYAQLLCRLATHYQCKHIMELGTSLGITTAYLAVSGAEHVVTFEGSPTIASLARKHFTSLQLHQIQIIEGNMDLTLPEFLKTNPHLDMVFVDGNHRATPTLSYFNQLLQHAHEHTIFVFDDIHWSKDMENAWSLIQSHEKVTLTIDLFFFGIVLIKKDFKERQHFSISF